MVPDHDLTAALYIAQKTKNDLEEKNPGKPLRDLFVVVMNACHPKGHAAAIRMMLNQGKTPEAARKMVALEVEQANRAQGAAMLGTVVMAPGVQELLLAAGEPKAITSYLREWFEEMADHDELRVLIMSERIRGTSLSSGKVDRGLN